MTLNITILTEKTIYQSSDLRLTDIQTKKIITDTSTKLVTLQYEGWDGFVSYTGIGRYWSRDTSDFLIEWLTGMKNATFEDVATQIRDKGNEWLLKIERNWCRQRQTFVLAGFAAYRPQLAIISNFEDCLGRNDTRPGPSLTISRWRFESAPLVVVTGCKQSVSRLDRQILKRLIQNETTDPAQIRRKLAEVNRNASATTANNGTISPTCSVVSFRADGKGVLEGKVELRRMSFGMPPVDLREVAKNLGFDSIIPVGEVTFSSSKPSIPYTPCGPSIVIPDGSDRYTIREKRYKQFTSCWARDVNDAGNVLGAGRRSLQPSVEILWVSPVDGEPLQIGIFGNAGGINNSGDVAATTKMGDGSLHATRRSGAPVDLGCYRGRDSGAVAINASGLVVGWVCIDPDNRGQTNYRPSAWALNNQIYVLEDFGCDWGQAVDVNDAGLVLVVGYVGLQQRAAILWNPLTGTTEVIGDREGIYPMAITTDSVVLGKGQDRNGLSVACLAKRGGRWELLGTEAGFYATSMNDAGDVVGAMVRDGYEKPWLRRASGKIIWLPYFDQHWCRPSAINNSGVIVGTAETDHGAHALVWTP